MLGALASVLSTWLVTGILVVEAVDRVRNPVPVDGRRARPGNTGANCPPWPVKYCPIPAMPHCRSAGRSLGALRPGCVSTCASRRAAQ